MSLAIDYIILIAANKTAKKRNKNNEDKMKIEVDSVNGMIVVKFFPEYAEIVTCSLKLKDFLKDDSEECLGFEVTEDEAQEILDMNHSIKGFKGMTDRLEAK